VDLVQPKGESLREVGMAFRSLVTDSAKLRALRYAEALDIVVRYERAVEPHHKDMPTIQEALKAMRDNPKLSRFQWCEAVRSICDEALLSDFIRVVDRITATEEGNLDMSNSLNTEEEFLQLLRQKRSKAQEQATLTKEFNQARNFFSEEVRPNTDKNKNMRFRNKSASELYSPPHPETANEITGRARIMAKARKENSHTTTNVAAKSITKARTQNRSKRTITSSKRKTTKSQKKDSDL
jgi:hypothetical protein